MFFFLFPGHSQAHLYVADDGRSDLFKMSVYGGPLVPLNVSSKVQMSNPYGICYDRIRNWLYWTDSSLKLIGRISLRDKTVDVMNLTTGKKIIIFFNILAKSVCYL